MCGRAAGAPDHRGFDFLHEIGEIAAHGGDVRGRVLGAGTQPAVSSGPCTHAARGGYSDNSPSAAAAA